MVENHIENTFCRPWGHKNLKKESKSDFLYLKKIVVVSAFIVIQKNVQKNRVVLQDD